MVSQIGAAFAEWSRSANIQFQQIASTSSAQIDFSVGSIDGRGNILGEASYWYYGNRFTSAAIEFDSGEGWYTSQGGVVSSQGASFYVVALHEIGHAIGLGHYNSGPATMNAYLSPSINGLTQSDIDGIRAIYGAAPGRELFGSVVHDTSGPAGQIYALYDAILDRAPDALGFEHWLELMEHGSSLRDVAAALLNSPEGKLHVGGVEDGAFIDQLYSTAFHRQADAAGAQHQLQALNQGTSRAQIAINFALSVENQDGMAGAFTSGVFAPDKDASDVARLYYTLLDRAPDAGGLSHWTDLIEGGSTLQSVAQGLFASPESQSKHVGMTNAQFVTDLYDDALGRAPDAGGFQHWTSQLASGVSRADVALGLAQSIEAQNHWLQEIEQGWVLV
jgi:hypothetical protein